MSRLKRKIGGRVAGVGVGVALLMLGLEAPAFAALGVTAFSPGSGPVGCVVVITGTDFNNPNVVDVSFTNTTGTVGAVHAPFTIQSPTEIWTSVPGTAGNGPIRLTNSAAQSVDTTGFTVTTGAGGCAPTITSFTPTCGPMGTDVTVTGTNLLLTSGNEGSFFPVADPLGALVAFAPYGVAATPVTGADVSPTEVSVNVPSGVANGPIKVFTFAALPPTGVTSDATFSAGTCISDFSPQAGDVGTLVTITGVGFEHVTAVQFFDGIPATFTLASNTETTDTITTTVPFGAATGPITLVTADAIGGSVSTATDFTVGPPPPPKHKRAVTLRLRKHLIAKGKVKVPDGFTACGASVPVKIQRRQSGHWKTIKFTTTSRLGRYAKRLADRPGRYRVVAKRVKLASGDICLKDVSPVRKHSH